MACFSLSTISFMRTALAFFSFISSIFVLDGIAGLAWSDVCAIDADDVATNIRTGKKRRRTGIHLETGVTNHKRRSHTKRHGPRSSASAFFSDWHRLDGRRGLPASDRSCPRQLEGN